MLETLRHLRKAKRVTMKELASAIGVSEATISLYERGQRSPSYEVLLKLGEYFGVSVDYLLSGNDSSPENTQAILDVNPELLQLIADLSKEDQQLILTLLKHMKETESDGFAVWTGKGPYYFYNTSKEAEEPPENQ